MSTGILAAESLLVELMIVIFLVAALGSRTRLPYTVMLVVVGLGIAILPTSLPEIRLTPELILFILVPPLVFEAAFHLDVQQLRENLLVIVVLAVVGVLLTTAVVGGVVALAGVPLAIAALFGAIISATDPVAVVAILRELGAPRRLSTIMEGESLLNDGSAIVVTGILLTIAVTGQFSLTHSILEFITVTGGGLLVGVATGVVAVQILPRIDAYLVELTLTTIVAFGTYLLAERFHVSGVIAVVTAGVLVGNYGRTHGMSATTRIVVEHFWEYVTFAANSFVFLLIGFTVDFRLLVNNLMLIAVAIVAVLLGRFITVYGLGGLLNVRTHNLPMNYRHVMFWGGLRGAIALALVLAMPNLEGWLGPLQAMTFGVVLFTLLIQGTTIKWLLRAVGLATYRPEQEQFEMVRARLYAAQAAHRQLRNMHQAGALSESAWNEIDEDYRNASHGFVRQIHQLYEQEDALRREEILQAREDGLRAQRSALQDLLRRGLLSEHGYEELMGQIDEERERLEVSQVEGAKREG